MKDSADTRTLDLLATADRRAKYEAERKASGHQRRAFWIHRGDWAAGKEAGLFGRPNECPTGRDRISWAIGYAEALTNRDEAIASAAGRRLPV